MITTRRARSLALVLGHGMLATGCNFEVYGFGTESYAPAVCGNSKKDPYEECDPGPGSPDAANCTPECTLAVCGDGKAEASEQCDLGPENADDGPCTSECRTAVCGDGKVLTKTDQELLEQCDDGNNSPIDACTNSCQVARCGDGIPQEGEFCDQGPKNVPQGPCTPLCKGVTCGDGIVQGNEECDDKNMSDLDACTTACKIATCGDGFTWTDVETCDGDPGCSPNCTLATCGNNFVDPGEDCDPTAASRCVCRDTCVCPTCGDNILDDGEECDGPQPFGYACRACKLYFENIWSVAGPSKPIPQPTEYVNNPTLPSVNAGEIACFVISFWDYPDPPGEKGVNDDYRYTHDFEFELGVTHPRVGELTFFAATGNGTRAFMMRRPGFAENTNFTGPGGAVAGLSSKQALRFTFCDGNATDPDCDLTSAELIGDGLQSTETVCAGQELCSYKSNAGDLENVEASTLLGGLRGFKLKEANTTKFLTPNWNVCVHDPVPNEYSGTLDSMQVTVWRRKTFD